MKSASNSHVRVVEIGGLPIALRFSDTSFVNTVEQRYGNYLSSKIPELELQIDLSSPGISPDQDVQLTKDGEAWVLRRGDFVARWNPVSGRGQVRQDRSPYALDSVLRILHSLMLASRGGFLLHAASGVYDGRAYLFSGVSGAGKTTVSRLAPPGVILLTDEISYIRRERSGYVACGTPFSGELAKPGENCVAPVAGLFFLNKGPENRMEEMPASVAVRRLMRNILFFAEDQGLIETLLATACDFTERVPIRSLTFYPDVRVWDEIRNFEGAPAHA